MMHTYEELQYIVITLQRENFNLIRQNDNFRQENKELINTKKKILADLQKKTDKHFKASKYIELLQNKLHEKNEEIRDLRNKKEDDYSDDNRL